MDKSKNDLLNIVPMTDYTPPKVPTLDEVYKNPAPLKKLPLRWAKNAAVAAAISIFGLSTLSGCFGQNRYTADGAFCLCNGYGVGYNGHEEFDLVMRLSGGGAGMSFYVVHLTEQETLSVIRRRLAEYGLNFCDTPPDYRTYCLEETLGLWRAVWPIGLSMFDAQQRVGIAHIPYRLNDIPFFGIVDTSYYEASFANQTQSRITTGVFTTPSAYPPRNATEDERNAFAAESRPTLENDLNRQISRFVARLRNLGVIE